MRRLAGARPNALVVDRRDGGGAAHRQADVPDARTKHLDGGKFGRRALTKPCLKANRLEADAAPGHLCLRDLAQYAARHCSEDVGKVEDVLVV